MALIITLTALFGSIYALLGESGLVAVMKMRARATQLRYEIADKDHENSDLRQLIRPLREGDPEAIEQLAREKLYMVRPGDTLYMLPPEPQPDPPVLVESASPTGPPAPSRR